MKADFEKKQCFPQWSTLKWNISVVKNEEGNCGFPWRKSNSGNSKFILNNVRGHLNSGELVAILGVSGCGKTTLLNLLAGQSSDHLKTEGRIAVNGRSGVELLRNCSSLVNQFHIIPNDTTPRKHTKFHALLRTGSNFTDNEKLLMADKALEKMGLMQCADNKIGQPGYSSGISGGQRRRLGFAVEVLSKPAFLLCDEPTTGLDSNATLEILTLLKELSKLGMGILCSIHQLSPRVLELFDRIILMAEGRTAFTGTTQQALEFLSSMGFHCPVTCNPAEYFMRVLNPRTGNHKVICDTFNKSTKEEKTNGNVIYGTFNKEASGRKMKDNVMSEKMIILKELSQTFNEDHLQIRQKSLAPWYKQVWVLTKRTFEFVNYISSSDFTQPAVLVVLSVLFGIIFHIEKPIQEKEAKNIMGFSAYLSCFATMAISLPLAEVKSKWLPIFFSERKKNIYSTGAFMVSQAIFEIVVITILVSILSSIVFGMTGICHSMITFFYVTASLICATFAMTGLANTLVCIFSNRLVARVVQGLLFYASFPFNSYFYRKRNMPLYFSWLRNFVWQNHAMNSVSSLLFQDLEFNSTKCESNQTYCAISGYEILAREDIPYGSERDCIGALVLLGLTFRLIQSCSLYIRSRS